MECETEHAIFSKAQSGDKTQAGAVQIHSRFHTEHSCLKQPNDAARIDDNLALDPH